MTMCHCVGHAGAPIMRSRPGLRRRAAVGSKVGSRNCRDDAGRALWPRELTTTCVAVASVMATLFWQVTPTTADVLAVSQLEVCADSGDPRSVQCEQKFVAVISVAAQQGTTESLGASVSIDTAVGEHGEVYDIHDTVEISVAKSPVYYTYPTRYVREFNAGPAEKVELFDGGFNHCSDRSEIETNCGSYQADGERLEFSNGFCCSCELGDYFGGDLPRSQLACQMLSTYRSGSHCLVMGPMWYSAYEVLPPVVEEFLNVSIRVCKGDTGECTVRHEMLGTSYPAFCIPLTEGGACALKVSVLGDLASKVQPPDYSSKYLLAPSVCTSPRNCLQQELDPVERWMLMDKFMTTTGEQCDKIGISHEGFARQGNRCEMPPQTCLANQINDLYAKDVAAEAAGVRGEYFLKNFAADGQALKLSRHVGQDSSRGALMFEQPSFADTITLVRIELAADAISWTQAVSPGAIRSVLVDSFTAQSGNGFLVVRVANIGKIESEFIASVECDPGIVPPPSHSVSLHAPPHDSSEKDIRFELHARYSTTQAHLCTVKLQNSQFEITDQKNVSFTTFAVELDRETQGGSAAGDTALSITSVSVDHGQKLCWHSCLSMWNIMCSIKACQAPLLAVSTIFLILFCCVCYGVRNRRCPCCGCLKLLMRLVCCCCTKQSCGGSTKQNSQTGRRHRSRNARSRHSSVTAELMELVRTIIARDQQQQYLRSEHASTEQTCRLSRQRGSVHQRDAKASRSGASSV